MIPKPKEAETGETGPKEAGPEKARPKEAGPEEVKPKEAGHKEEVKKENIELTGEEEIDHGYEGPVNTKEKKNHNETKAKYQAGRDKAFDTEDDAEYLELIGDDAKYLELIGDQAKDQVPQDWLEKLLSNLGWYGKDDDNEEDDARHTELDEDQARDQVPKDQGPQDQVSQLYHARYLTGSGA